MTLAYFDASALVKLALVEPESAALRLAVAGTDRCTSQIGRVEFERAVRRVVADADDLIEAVLEATEVIPVHAAIAVYAARLRPAQLRTLDAIHLSTMRAVQEDLDVAFVYDDRLAAAAIEYGIPVRAPA